MKTGIYYWFGYPLPGRERMRLIASAGFDCVSLWWGDEYAAENGPREALPGLARESGLLVENIHAPFSRTNLLWQDKAGWEDVLERSLQCVDACREHDIPVMVLHLTVGETPPPPNLLGVERIRRIVERAGEKGVTIALENLRKPEYMGYVFERIDSDHLRFCYDSGHENCFQGQKGLLRTYGDRLTCLHLHDNDGTADQHLLPGEGTIPWAQVTADLAWLGYGGSISLEVTNAFSEVHRDMPAEDFLAEAFRRADALAGGIMV
ncbi:MAG: sugar phosphate isomerase/epimerase [Clostridia bacterium]